MNSIPAQTLREFWRARADEIARVTHRDSQGQIGDALRFQCQQQAGILEGQSGSISLVVAQREAGPNHQASLKEWLAHRQMG